MQSQPELVPFSRLGLSPIILKAIESSGYSTPTPIQSRTIPIMLEGRDIIGQAKTGTGKTASFALPIIQGVNLEAKETQVLVLTPTRELALQVAEAFRKYSMYVEGFRVLALYGGQSMATQIQALKRGVQIVIGTPGRVMDHVRRRTLHLDTLHTLVLDEADEMLKMGFLEDVEWILGHTPENKQVALFSATMPPAIRQVAQKYLRNPEEIKIQSQTTTVEGIEQFYLLSSASRKIDDLSTLLEAEEFDACIIFARTRNATLDIAQRLEQRGHACAAMNGDLTQALRERTIKRLRQGELNIIVATDVAARGLDVERISHVINYDMPFDTESYVHRIGRTGRAGRAGRAILFVSPRERRGLKAIEKATGQIISELILPSTKQIQQRKVERFKEQVAQKLSEPNLEFYAEIVDQLVNEKRVSLRDIAASLCFLAQQSSPLLDSTPQYVRPEREASEFNRKAHRRDGVRTRPSRNRDRDSRQPEAGMVSCRIEVGRNQGLKPGGIVAAIAESAGIEGRVIGRIKLHDNYSLVDLPETLSGAAFQSLKAARVMNRPMRLKRLQ